MMSETKKEFNKESPFYIRTLDIAKAKFDKYEREGYTKDTEGLYICPECNTNASKYDVVFGQIMPCDCECKKAKKAEEERERQVRLTEERRIRCFVSKEMRGHTFSKDNELNPKITTIMKNYVSNFSELKKDGRGLLLFGSTGTGKTFFASCIGNALIDNGYYVRQTTISRLASEMSQTYDKQSIIDSYAHSDLVIIDDLGTERQTDFVKQLIFDIIDTFYNERTPMIITTNLTAEEFKNPSDKENVRIYQRILEHCAWVEIKNDSQRVQNIIKGYKKDREFLGL